MTARELPLADGQRPERADASANRLRILEAAGAVFATQDARRVSMEDIAKAAGVGRATLYRRFPTVGAVAEALLDAHERELQAAILNGPPPLGPGAEPGERLAAFYGAMIDLLEQHSRLVLGTEIGQARFTTGAYGFWRAHARLLATEAGVSDPEVLADILLAPLAPDLYLHQREQGATADEIAQSLQRLARAALTTR